MENWFLTKLIGAGFRAGWNGLKNSFPLLTLLSCVGFAFPWRFPNVWQRWPHSSSVAALVGAGVSQQFQY